MIAVLAGPNSYERIRQQKQIVDAFVAEHTEISLERLDGEEASYDQIREALESLPFLANKKLIILREPSASKQFSENYEKLLENLADTTDVLIIEPKPDKRTTYYKYLKKQPGFVACDEPSEQQLVSWLVSEADAQGGTINAGDAQYLIERVNGNQALLSNEITKLVSYNNKVTRTTIDLLCEKSPKSSIFDLLETAFRGNKRAVISLYDEQRRLKVEPPQIIAMLAWQLHVIAVIAASVEQTDQAVAKQAKLNPFVVGKSRTLAKRLGLPKTKQLIQRLVELDELSKTGQIDQETALKSYLLTIS